MEPIAGPGSAAPVGGTDQSATVGEGMVLGSLEKGASEEAAGHAGQRLELPRSAAGTAVLLHGEMQHGCGDVLAPDLGGRLLSSPLKDIAADQEAVGEAGDLTVEENATVGEEEVATAERSAGNLSPRDYNFMVQHLGRDPSDHAPLLLTALSRLDNKPKSFRFLNIWTTKPELLGVIRQAWEGTFLGPPLQRLVAKLREVKQQVQLWSRDSFGDIFKGVRKARGEVLRLEGLFDSDPSESNLLALQEARTGLKNSLMIEEGYWRQKARVKWIREGDKNSKYFHSIVTERRAKAVIHRIKGTNGVWLTEEDRIAVEAVEYFKAVFSAEPFSGSWDTLDVVPHMISHAQNEELVRIPEVKKIREVVFGIDGESAAGPDGFTGRFFTFAWEVVAKDGRQIFDNVLLAQELITDIGKASRGGNVVLKIDMAKAYDRVSWPFLIQVLRHFDFCEVWIDMIWRLISNVWFSVIVNGAPQGFFKSSRGIRQGDPISPSLFVLCAEVLSLHLNSLSRRQGFVPFRVPKGCSVVTHLAYADDIIIFSSGMKRSLQLVMQVLEDYTSISGQKGAHFTREGGGRVISLRFVPRLQVGFYRGRRDSYRQVGSCAGLYGLSSCTRSIARGCILVARISLQGSRTFGRGWWDLQGLSRVLPSEWVSRVLREAPSTAAEADEMVWAPTNSGAFTITSAYQIVRQGGNVSRLFGSLWHQALPSKISFFMLRLMYGRLPLMDVLHKFGFLGPSKCFCCSLSPSPETISHIFCTGEVARQVWGCFEGIIGGFSEALTIRHKVMSWWVKPNTNPYLGFVHRILPSLICWNLWKMRNMWIFEGKLDSVVHVCDRIFLELRECVCLQFREISLPCSSRIGFFEMIGRLRRKVIIREVRWEGPTRTVVKLNVNGCSRGNPGRSGGGGLFRDSEGRFLLGFSCSFGEATSLQAELKALLFGVRLGVSRGLVRLHLESDSMVLVRIIQGKVRCPWRLQKELRELQQYGRHFDAVSHCYRETNKPADRLSNAGVEDGHTIIYEGYSALPRLVRGDITLDVYGFPSFRRCWR
ncbi:uncharacterized protein [Coffea arabica]|uniref:RNase H type-1 domain-containing protein n=1 Tax=Coffea arabica TaxID=13443 RepID=A0A6P6X3D9_COFAR